MGIDFLIAFKSLLKCIHLFTDYPNLIISSSCVAFEYY